MQKLINLVYLYCVEIMTIIKLILIVDFQGFEVGQ